MSLMILFILLQRQLLPNRITLSIVIQDFYRNANVVTFVTMLTSLQTGNDSTYGAGYQDPNEPSSPNIKTDAQFDTDVNTMHGQITSANSYHQGVVSGTITMVTLLEHTYANTDYDSSTSYRDC